MAVPQVEVVFCILLPSLLMAALLRLLGVALLLAAAPGCQEQDPPAASAPAAASSAVDTGTVDTLHSADALAATPADVPSPASTDSIAALQAALAAELRAVRATRDSLEAGLAAQAAVAPAERGTTASPAADTTDRTSPAADRGAGGVGGITLGEAGTTARNFGLRVAFAVFVLALVFFAIRSVVYVLETLAERSAERRLLYKRIVPIARVLLWALALYIILRGIFEVNAQSLIAAAAAIGVAVGFAAQDLLKNIFGGLVIIFDQPFQAGDKISVGGTYGEVVGIGLRSTRIVTPDDNLVSVPNAQVVDGQVSNANAGALDCQVVTDLYLPGWVDETRAKQIAYQAAAGSKYVYFQKPITVIVKDAFDDEHVVHLKVKAYVLDTRYEFLLMSDVTERARRAFRAAGLLPPATRAYVDLPGAAPAPDAASDVAPSPAVGDGTGEGTGDGTDPSPADPPVRPS
jgi:small-conductance mechanosensitive channel